MQPVSNWDFEKKKLDEGYRTVKKRISEDESEVLIVYPVKIPVNVRPIGLIAARAAYFIMSIHSARPFDLVVNI